MQEPVCVLREQCPEIYKAILENGYIDTVLTMDNFSVPNFDQWKECYELPQDHSAVYRFSTAEPCPGYTCAGFWGDREL